ncbi:hypothetical protein K504DRAFT_310910 [Pleomassaria siparia CBS 279.74]|uniref:Uncharacterized protein n=1 Tax=Pleomassaria siparia CBS 279.74 TaxID=1314801 RepID=A0A6G1JPG5_9PLEO|nr:hypothetical protein K504DRAFT_310910 [Pleomassaria siparia CBS 279.74]
MATIPLWFPCSGAWYCRARPTRPHFFIRLSRRHVGRPRPAGPGIVVARQSDLWFRRDGPRCVVHVDDTSIWHEMEIRRRPLVISESRLGPESVPHARRIATAQCCMC